MQCDWPIWQRHGCSCEWIQENRTFPVSLYLSHISRGHIESSKRSFNSLVQITQVQPATPSIEILGRIIWNKILCASLACSSLLSRAYSSSCSLDSSLSLDSSFSLDSFSSLDSFLVNSSCGSSPASSSMYFHCAGVTEDTLSRDCLII